MGQQISSRYDLTDTEVNKLCWEFLKTVKRPDSRFGCYITVGKDKFANLARHVESKVFHETFKNDPAVMVKEYGPYDTASTFFMVIDHETAMPVGALRVIEHSEAGLKVHTDLINTPLKLKPAHLHDHYKVSPAETVEVGTLAVERGYRGRKFGFIPSLLLYRALYTEVISHPKNKMVLSVIDQKPYHQLLRLGMPFKPVLNSGPFPYIDSEASYSVYAYTSDFYPSVRRKSRFYLWSVRPSRQYMRRMMRQLMHGRGLDHMMAYSK